MISIERAGTADRTAIESLLQASGLPTAGLELAATTAVVARAETEDREIVGCAAIEPYGSIGLLRSVCVAPRLRSTGLGRRLVAEAEATATSLGIGQLYLLTETAGDWVPASGLLTDGARHHSGATPWIARVLRCVPGWRPASP